MGLMTLNIAEPIPQPICNHAADVEYWVRQVSACALIEDLAGWYGVHSETVWRCLSDVSDVDLWMLDSPGGWAILAGEVQAKLGVDAPPYTAQVH